MDKRATASYWENHTHEYSPIVVRPLNPLKRRGDFTTFLGLPRQFYHRDPHWIEPLRLERRQHLSKRNPLFQHLDWQGWIAWRGLDASRRPILHPADAPTAFIVALPNINEAIRDLGGRLMPFGWMKLLWRSKVRYPLTGRIPLMGVIKRY